MNKPRDGKKSQRPAGAEDGKPLTDGALWQRVTQTVQPLDPAAKNQINPDAPLMAELLGEVSKPAAPPKTSPPPSSKPVVDLSGLKNGVAHPAASPGHQAWAHLQDDQRPAHHKRPQQTDWPLTGALTPGVDRRTASKLARGQYPIDARLDLHGDRQHQAQERLERFVIASHQAGHRCLLVITGKGKRQLPKRDGHADGHAGAGDQLPGVIRRRFVDWLSAPHLKPLILAIKTAQPKDGGEGAFYILLRRHR